MSQSVYNETSGGPSEKLRTPRITSLDDEDKEDAPVGDISDEDDYDEEDDDDADTDEDRQPVTLGFAESPKYSWSLLPQFFPSKAGGTPAWLDPNNLPNGRSCVCDFCGGPLQFLLQVYAPLSEKDSTFHRTIFIFMCPSMACLLKDQHGQWNRQPEQASRSEPPKNGGTDKLSRTGVALCSWCGTWRGDKTCSNCRSVRYCSEKHQAAHWRSGHKTNCQQFCLAPVASSSTSNGISAEIQKAASNSLWPQFEIVNEDECDSKDNEFAAPLVSQSQIDNTAKSLQEIFVGRNEIKSWASFEERISRAPEQVLRYYRFAKAKPLWPMTSGQPSKTDIPVCSYCGGPRSSEFQVLPQLLYYFGVENEENSLDWATIVVYTCEASCEGSSTVYKEEFAWVQLAHVN